MKFENNVQNWMRVGGEIKVVMVVKVMKALIVMIVVRVIIFGIFIARLSQKAKKQFTTKHAENRKEK
jgi:hypothetical protein